MSQSQAILRATQGNNAPNMPFSLPMTLHHFTGSKKRY